VRERERRGGERGGAVEGGRELWREGENAKRGMRGLQVI
jgi:hypothetical protein